MMIIIKIDNKTIFIYYKFIKNRIIYDKVYNKIVKLFISDKIKKVR